jgi:hypothetical protein
VTMIDPYYAYAWHDLFGALYELAKRGDAEIAAARRALDMARRTGTGQPGLGAAYLDECERRLEGLEAWLASPAGKGQAALGTRRGDFVKADEHTRAGKALLARGEAEGALREFEAALRADPRFLEARSARGALLVGFDRLEEGLKRPTIPSPATTGPARRLLRATSPRPCAILHGRSRLPGSATKRGATRISPTSATIRA